METLYEVGEVAVARLDTLGEAEELVALLEGIAESEGWRHGGNLRACLPGSRHFAAFSQGQMAGGLQLVLPDGSGKLPCHALWPEAALPPNLPAAHATVLALLPEFRGRRGLFWPLCVEAWRHLVSLGVGQVVLEATPPMLTKYRAVGWPLEVVGELRQHWGEECFLCATGLAEAVGAVVSRAVRSPSYRAVVTQAVRPAARCAASSALP